MLSNGLLGKAGMYLSVRNKLSEYGLSSLTEGRLKESYSQIWCMPMKSSGDLVGLFDLFSINEFHAFNNLCQVFEAA